MNSVVHMPPLPQLWRGQHWWEGQDVLPGWADWVMEKSNSRTHIWVDTADPSQVPGRKPYPEPAPSQVRAYEFIKNNGDTVREAVLRGIIDHFPNIAAEYWEAEQMILPRVDIPQDLRPLIQLWMLRILQSEREGLAYFAFIFKCDWDREHGLGVAMHGLRVVTVGHEDLYELWLPEHEGGAWVWRDAHSNRS